MQRALSQQRSSACGPAYQAGALYDGAEDCYFCSDDHCLDAKYAYVKSLV
jgi:hypothetical protein